MTNEYAWQQQEEDADKGSYMSSLAEDIYYKKHPELHRGKPAGIQYINGLKPIIVHDDEAPYPDLDWRMDVDQE